MPEASRCETTNYHTDLLLLPALLALLFWPCLFLTGSKL